MTHPGYPEFPETSFQTGYNKIVDTTEYKFYTVDIGQLNIVEGKIIACDPLLFYEDKPFDTNFPIGKYPVELAIAKVNGDERVGFSRIKFSNSVPESWTIAVSEEQDISTLKPGDIFGYGIDSGTGAFMDISGGKEFLNFLSEEENNHTKIIDEIQKTYSHTRSWLLWTKNGFDVAMFSSGWGDGLYASYIGFDKDKNICRLVTDFGLLEWED
jgi:hypothetical protein